MAVARHWIGTSLFALVATLGMFVAAAIAQEGSVDPLGGNAPPGISGKADDFPFPTPTTKGAKPSLNLSDAFGLGGNVGGSGDEEVTFTAEWKLEPGTRTGRLTVKANIPETWHIYSLTQPKGGPQPSTLDPKKGSQFELNGAFLASPLPHVTPPGVDENLFKVASEEHEGIVTWTANITFLGTEDPKKIPVVLKYTGQRCQNNGSCVPFSNDKITAKFAGEIERSQKLGHYKPKPSLAAVEWEGELSSAHVVPGGKLELKLTAKPSNGWHIYEYQAKDADRAGDGKPSLFVLNLPSGWKYRAPRPSVSPKGPSTLGSSSAAAVRYHEEPVTWIVELLVPATATPEAVNIAGQIGFQTCNDASCLPPVAAQFMASASITAVADEKAKPVPLEFDNYKEGYDSVAKMAAAAPPAFGVLNLSVLLWQLATALVGGVLLNFMPCVLPVLGLKLLGIAQQAGQSRMKVLMQNIWYTAGLMVVFLTLATLAAFLNFGWGQHFQSLGFRVSMLVLTFAMALSFLGTWEIPIPGFATSDKASELQTQDGAVGAFFKGIFTTILGVSCSGPFLGAVFGYTLSQEWYVTYAIFVAVGLGMASPFFAVGLIPAFRKLIPKPGAWMDTFKSLMGFALMGVVVFLFSTLDTKLYLPTLALLVGVGFACWWIGQVHAYEDWTKVMVPWIGGTAVAVLTGFLSFTYLGPQEDLYPWEKYSEARLVELQKEGKTVMLDFTAEWCLNCHVNYRNAINTRATRDLLTKNNAVAMKADWTNKEDSAVIAKLEQLNSRSIPVLVFYPAGKPSEAVILRDIVTQQQVIDELAKAGPSVSEEKEKGTAKAESKSKSNEGKTSARSQNQANTRIAGAAASQ